MDHVFIVSRAQLSHYRRRGAKTYRLELADGSPLTTEKAFRDCVVRTFPMNPPFSARNHVPGAMSDSIFGGLMASNSPVVDIIWPNADSTPLSLLLAKVPILDQVAVWTNPHDPDRLKHDEAGVDIRIILVCSNEKNKASLRVRLLP